MEKLVRVVSSWFSFLKCFSCTINLFRVSRLRGKSQVGIIVEVDGIHTMVEIISEVYLKLGAHRSGAKEDDRTHWLDWVFSVPSFVAIGDFCQDQEILIFAFI